MISYPNKDLKEVRNYVKHFVTAGITTWMFTDDITPEEKNVTDPEEVFVYAYQSFIKTTNELKEKQKFTLDEIVVAMNQILTRTIFNDRMKMK